MPEMTLATLRNRVQSTLGLKATGNELTLLDGYLNEGYEDVLTRTRCYVNCGDLVTTPDTWKYQMPEAVLAIMEWFTESGDGIGLPFERTVSRHILDLRQGAGADDQVRYYALEGYNLLLLWPTPSGTQELSFFYVPRPTPMAAPTDTPTWVPSQWHRAVELYATWKMADYDDDGSSGVGNLYRVQYEGQDTRGGVLRDINRMKQWQAGRRLSPARAGRRPQWRAANTVDA